MASICGTSSLADKLDGVERENYALTSWYARAEYMNPTKSCCFEGEDLFYILMISATFAGRKLPIGEI